TAGGSEGSTSGVNPSGGGGSSAFSSATRTASIQVTLVNSPPTVTASADAASTFTEGGAAVAVDADITVADVDNDNLNQAVLTISNLVARDVLNLTDTANITHTYSNGVLTLSGSDTLAAYQAALRSVTFSSTDDNPTFYGTNTARTISVSVRDIHNATSVTPAARTVNVTGVNDAPA